MWHKTFGGNNDITFNLMTGYYTFNSVLGINDASRELDIKLFPNPTTSYLMINKQVEIHNLELYDVTGKLYQPQWSQNGVDLSELNKGLYFIRLTTDKGIDIQKIIKQ